MKTLFTVLATAFLLLTSPFPAGAQPAFHVDLKAPVHLIAVNDQTADRDTYTQKAHDEVQAWRQKLHDFNTKAKADGKDFDRTAKTDLNRAWHKTRIAARKLRTVGAEGWDVAKSDYEKASQDLTDAWHRIQPEHS
jgi:Skp family chaperone for outer membrane proteins